MLSLLRQQVHSRSPSKNAENVVHFNSELIFNVHGICRKEMYCRQDSVEKLGPNGCRVFEFRLSANLIDCLQLVGVWYKVAHKRPVGDDPVNVQSAVFQLKLVDDDEDKLALVEYYQMYFVTFVSTRDGHLGGGGGVTEGAECSSQRVGKNRRCQQNGKRDVC